MSVTKNNDVMLPIVVVLGVLIAKLRSAGALSNADVDEKLASAETVCRANEATRLLGPATVAGLRNGLRRVGDDD